MNTNFCSKNHRWLVVDDEAELSELIALALAEIATEPVENFISSPEALSHFASDPQGYDLVLTDRDMPGLNGLEFARRVHAISPRAKVILVSARVDDLSREELDRCGICGVVQKPFSLQSLMVAVRAFTVLPSAVESEIALRHAA